MKQIILTKGKMFFFMILCELQQLLMANIDSRIHHGKEANRFTQSVGHILFEGGFCSCVIIGQDLLLTSTHCFKFYLAGGDYDFDYKLQTICNGEMTTFNFDFNSLLIQRYSNGSANTDDAYDIAAIRTMEKFTKCSEDKIAKVSCRKAQEGTRMHLAGYGLDELQEPGILRWITVNMKIFEETYAYTFARNNPKRVDQGDSGGPCFDENWNVIGVSHAVYPEPSIGICTPLYPFYFDYLLS